MMSSQKSVCPQVDGGQFDAGQAPEPHFHVLVTLLKWSVCSHQPRVIGIDLHMEDIQLTCGMIKVYCVSGIMTMIIPNYM